MTEDRNGGVGTATPPGQMHRFVRVAGFYVNSELTLLQLSRYLWQQVDQFLGSEGKSASTERRSRVLPEVTVKASRVARHLTAYLLARSESQSDSSRDGELLSLPVAGDLAIVRRSGAVKVLDVRNNRVVTVLRDAEERAKLRERVELSERVAHLPFAPKVEQVDLPQGFFSEEFLSGSHPLNFAGCKDDFAEVYRPLLVEFLAAFPPRWADKWAYIESLRDDILAPDGLLQRMKPEERQTVTTFVEEIYQQLACQGGRIPLVLSHGDYFSGNIVIDSHGHHAIDWANMGFRSPLHDLYYLYMNHCCRAMEWPRVERRSRAAINSLRAALDPGQLEELSEFLTPRDELRKLFYLECVQVPLVRCTDPTDRYLESMLVRIGWYTEYERAMQEEGVSRESMVNGDSVGLLEGEASSGSA